MVDRRDLAVGSDIYLPVDHELPNVKMARLPGTLITRVFEGRYRDAGKWVQQKCAHVEGEGKQVSQTYFYYATCPKCAKLFGKNQVVLRTQLVDD